MKIGILTLTAIVSCLLTVPALAQDSNPNRELMRKSYDHFDKLLGRVSPLINEAKEKRRAKDYKGAEALCKQALEMLKNAKPFQQIPNEELAEIYLAEGHYQKALDLWLPMYNPKGMPTDISCGMAVAYAKTGREDEGAKILGVLYNFQQVLLARSISVQSLPLSDELSSRTVEATALLLQARLQDVDPKETTERVKRAYVLVPWSAFANYQLARNYDSNKAMPIEKILPYYYKAYLKGDDRLQSAVMRAVNARGYSLADLKKYL